MDRRARLTKYLLFFFLVVFPFGQLFRIPLSQFGITIQPIDLVSIISLFLLTKEDFKNKSFITILYLLGFGQIFSLRLFDLNEIVPGLFYSLRLIAYLAFYLSLKKLFVKKANGKLITNSLIVIFVVAAIFGWVQYLLLPDFRSFKALGWDDHLFRLIGTFLDPGFMGIVLVLGFTLTLWLYLKKKTKTLLIFSVLLFVSVAFTYSRASYLAIIGGSLILTYLCKRFKVWMLILLSLFLLIFILPRPSSSGVELERTFSVDLRISNYKEGVKIFAESPVFGIGFNNLCAYKTKYLEIGSKDSHSCGGLNSSIIYVLATTGIVGLIILGNLIIQALKKVNPNNNYHQILLSSLVVVGVHSQFDNSLFYPWVMGYLAILGALSVSRSKVNG